MMEPGTAPFPDDHALLARLRYTARQVDPMPVAVQVAARAAIRWRAPDPEPAALVHDSVLGAAAPGVLAAATVPRALTFTAPGLSIELQAETAGEAGGLRLVGRLVPPQAAEVMVRHGARLITVRADGRGRFAVRGVAPGPLSLRCRLDAASGASRLVETAWLTL
jgi:hypothetical protein